MEMAIIPLFLASLVNLWVRSINQFFFIDKANQLRLIFDFMLMVNHK